MPTVTVRPPVTIQEVADALHDQLGSRYEVTEHGSGSHEALKIKQGGAASATVHLSQDNSTTTLHVHGGDLLISRLVNELGIAKRVAAGIEAAFLPGSPARTNRGRLT